MGLDGVHRELCEVQHLAFMPLEDKAWGLLNVHLFLENAIEECRLDVHVMHCPAFRGSMGKQQPDGLKSHNWGEDFIKVNSLARNISLGDESGLVLGDDPGCVLLGLVDPLEADRPRVQWQLDQLPGAARLDGSVSLASSSRSSKSRAASPGAADSPSTLST